MIGWLGIQDHNIGYVINDITKFEQNMEFAATADRGCRQPSNTGQSKKLKNRQNPTI